MDKFFYRLILQPIIKGILIGVLSLFCTAIAYTIFASVLKPVNGKVDYWVQLVVIVALTVIFCFMLITVKDDYSSLDINAYSVGKFWKNRSYKNKRVRWIYVELMMLPLLLIAVVLGFLFYRAHADKLGEYADFYTLQEVDATIGLEFFVEKLGHFLKAMFCVFFFWQWMHVRGFAKKGRCSKCKTAFAFGCYRANDKTVDHYSKIRKKARKEVVGANYRVTYEDDREVDRTKIGDIYETRYDYYRTDTEITTYSYDYNCYHCGAMNTRFDSYSSFDTKKIP